MNSSARLLAVPTLAVGLVLGSAAVATALPAWDIGIYDRCIQNIPDDVLLDNRGTDAVHECCWKSGGSWDGKTNKCVAPPAEGQSGRAPLSQVPTHVLTPSQPEQVPGGVLTPEA